MLIKDAVIMAGGEGVRLRPLTYMIPKPLLPFGSVTVIEHSIKNLAESGVENVYIMTGYQDQRFQDCLAYKQRYGINIHLLKEPKKLGTIGGLHYLKNSLTRHFLLMNGDLIFKIDFLDLANFHFNHNAVMTVCSNAFSYQLPYGLLKTSENNRVQQIIEKPKYSYTISAGIYVLDPTILSRLTGQYLNATELLESLINDQQIVVNFQLRDQWIDMGQVHDYEEALSLVDSWENREEIHV